jgi:hypothetical protein
MVVQIEEDNNFVYLGDVPMLDIHKHGLQYYLDGVDAKSLKNDKEFVRLVDLINYDVIPRLPDGSVCQTVAEMYDLISSGYAITPTDRCSFCFS